MWYLFITQSSHSHHTVITQHIKLWKSLTCEVDGLDRLDEIRLLHLKPVEQLRYEAHDVKLRKRTYLVTRGRAKGCCMENGLPTSSRVSSGTVYWLRLLQPINYSLYSQCGNTFPSIHLSCSCERSECLHAAPVVRTADPPQPGGSSSVNCSHKTLWSDAGCRDCQPLTWCPSDTHLEGAER